MDEGKRSKIIFTGRGSLVPTDETPDDFYDENGNRHTHYAARHVQEALCSNGHSLRLTSSNRCIQAIDMDEQGHAVYCGFGTLDTIEVL